MSAKQTDHSHVTAMNRAHIQRHFSKAAPSYDDAAILQKTVALSIDERLELTTLNPNTILDIGAGTGLLTQHLVQRYPAANIYALDLSINMLQQAKPRFEQLRFNWLAPFKPHLTHRFLKPLCFKSKAQAINADAYQLPFADGSIDLIVSNLMLQWVDDLDLVFKEFRRVLRPEGLIMFSSFGPDTLKELRQAWLQVDPDSEHVNQFIDMHDVGDALIRAGFGQPVMDIEPYTLTYDTPIKVLQDLKAIGATNANSDRTTGLMGKTKFQAMLNAYESLRDETKFNGKLPATYEVVHGHAWAAQEVVKGPNRDRSGLVELSLDEFAKQVKKPK